MPTDPIPAPLAALLDAERVRQGLSLSEVARRADLWPTRVHAVLTGVNTNPGILTVRAVLKALGHDLGWLAKRLP